MHRGGIPKVDGNRGAIALVGEHPGLRPEAQVYE